MYSAPFERTEPRPVLTCHRHKMIAGILWGCCLTFAFGFTQSMSGMFFITVKPNHPKEQNWC